MDKRADEAQREGLMVIFSGQGGGWPGDFAAMIGEMRGIEYVPITFEIADDLAYWRPRCREGDGAGRGTDRSDAPPATGFSSITLPAPRSGPDRSRPGEQQRSTVPTASASSGSGTAAQANTSRSTGKAPRPSPRNGSRSISPRRTSLGRLAAGRVWRASERTGATFSGTDYRCGIDADKPPQLQDFSSGDDHLDETRRLRFGASRKATPAAEDHEQFARLPEGTGPRRLPATTATDWPSGV